MALRLLHALAQHPRVVLVDGEKIIRWAGRNGQ
jgi:hypothetical protein